MSYDEIYSKLKNVGQEQLLDFYDELNDEEKENLLKQIEKIDFSILDLINHQNEEKKKENEDDLSDDDAVYGAFRLRKTALPLPERLRSVLFACYLTGLFCLTLFQPAIAELYRLLFGLPGAGLRWSVNFSFRLSLDFHRRFDSENLFNLLMFLPFGILYPLSRDHKSWRDTLWAGLLLTIIIELVQPVMGRSFDANDILLNFSGVLFSTTLFFLIRHGIAAKST